MLPYLPPLPPLASIARVVAGTLVAAAGVACVAAPAPWHTLVLPLVFVGTALALPVLLPIPTE